MVVGVGSVDERNAIATLFNKSVDFTFPVNFNPTVAKIVSLFKEQKKVVDETTD
jgi:hypothetical protein